MWGTREVVGLWGTREVVGLWGASSSAHLHNCTSYFAPLHIFKKRKIHAEVPTTQQFARARDIYNWNSGLVRTIVMRCEQMSRTRAATAVLHTLYKSTTRARFHKSKQSQNPTNAHTLSRSRALAPCVRSRVLRARSRVLSARPIRTASLRARHQYGPPLRASDTPGSVHPLVLHAPLRAACTPCRTSPDQSPRAKQIQMPSA